MVRVVVRVLVLVLVWVVVVVVLRARVRIGVGIMRVRVRVGCRFGVTGGAQWLTHALKRRDARSRARDSELDEDLDRLRCAAACSLRTTY